MPRATEFVARPLSSTWLPQPARSIAGLRRSSEHITDALASFHWLRAPESIKSSWRLSSTELSMVMVPHLSTYRISWSTLPIFRRDVVVASVHRLPIFSTSARRDVLLSAIGRLLLPALDFGTVYLLTSGLPRHSITSSSQKLKTHLFRPSYPNILTASP